MKQLTLFERIIFYPSAIAWTIWLINLFMATGTQRRVESVVAAVGVFVFWVIPIYAPMQKWIYRPFLLSTVLAFLAFAYVFLFFYLDHLKYQ